MIAAPLPSPDVLVAVECVAVKGGGTPVGDAMLAGDTLYIGGQTAPEETGIEAQTTGAWKRVERLIAEAGMSLDDVVSTTNVLATGATTAASTPASDNSCVRRIRRAPPSAPGSPIPARALQVEAIAHRDGRNAKVIEVVGLMTVAAAASAPVPKDLAASCCGCSAIRSRRSPGQCCVRDLLHRLRRRLLSVLPPYRARLDRGGGALPPGLDDVHRRDGRGEAVVALPAPYRERPDPGAAGGGRRASSRSAW